MIQLEEYIWNTSQNSTSESCFTKLANITNMISWGEVVLGEMKLSS